MTVIRTSTGSVQEIATEDGPMTTAAGSRQMGVKDAEVVGATLIPGADTYFYPNGSGMQEVTPVAGGGVSPITILGPSLLAWWTADRADLITLSSTAVTSWKDVVADYDAAQGLSAARPLYSATSFNGAPSVIFDSVDDELTLASQPFPAGASPSEIWAIVQQDALAADATVRAIAGYGGAASTARRGIERAVVASNLARATAGNGAAPVSATDIVDFSGRHVVRGAFSAIDETIATNGGAPVSAAVVPATGASRLRIGALSNSTPGNFWNGKIRDVLVTGPLTTDQAAALLAWALPRRML